MKKPKSQAKKSINYQPLAGFPLDGPATASLLKLKSNLWEDRELIRR
jgi:hypothetical protein